MESIWTGSVENAFFDGEKFDKSRTLKAAEYEYCKRNNQDGAIHYILGVDVGRKGCQSVVTVVKVIPRPEGPAFKNLVNIYTLEDDHFEHQSIAIKRLYYKYHARRIVLDGNGLGIGLVDYMIKPNVDADGTILPSFGVENDPDGYYKKFRQKDTELDAIYIMKANAAINTEAHTNFQSQLTTGKLRFLVEEKIAQEKLLGTKLGQGMTPEKRAEYLKPYTLTSILKEELSNLREELEGGINIILKQANKRIGKDKFSSLEYALWYIRQEEDSKKKRKSRDFSKWMFKN